MALIPLKDAVTITPISVSDGWGTETSGTPVSYPCRIDESTKLVRDQQGSEVVSNTQILIENSVAVGYNDEISFTDVTGQQVTRKPLSVSRVKDLTKVLFTRIDL